MDTRGTLGDLMDSDSYYQPREDDWDRYEQKMEEITNDIRDADPDLTDEEVEALAYRALEEYVEGMADYEADREYQARKEGERDGTTQGG